MYFNLYITEEENNETKTFGGGVVLKLSLSDFWT